VGTCFISYRREDTKTVSGRLRESLKKRLDGKWVVFRDSDSLKAGERWPEIIDKSITDKAVVLALFGTNWVTVETQRRLQDGSPDWNRLELELALQRRARVILFSSTTPRCLPRLSYLTLSQKSWIFKPLDYETATGIPTSNDSVTLSQDKGREGNFGY
jgi:hypothetical protein